VKVLDFIFAARPMLHLPIWTIYLLSLWLLGRIDLTPRDFLIVAALSLNAAAAYYINQIYDYQSDLINEKLGFLQKGLLDKNQLIAVAVILWSISVIISFWVNWGAGVINIMLIILGLLYSLPPARLKDRPIWGLAANSIGIGVLIPMAAAFITGKFSGHTILPCLYFFLTVASAHLMTVIPDRQGDIRTGKKTLAFYLSDGKIIVWASIFILSAILPALLMLNFFLIGVCLLTFVLLMTAASLKKTSALLFACKFPILLLSLLAGYYYPVYLIFLVVLLISTRLYYRRRFGIVYPRIN